jgi:hypothetical protein
MLQESTVSTGERNRPQPNDEVCQTHEGLIELARRLAPRADASEPGVNGSVGLIPLRRRSRVGGLLLFVLVLLALSPSIALILLVLSENEQTTRLLGFDPRKAAATLYALSTMVPEQESSRPKAPTKLRSAKLHVASAITAVAGRETPFAVAIDASDALPSESSLLIQGLPAGTTFSAGRASGDSGWAVLMGEVANAWMMLPLTAAGDHDLALELRAPRGDIVATAATQLLVSDARDPLPRPDESQRISAFIEHGNKMIEVGYFAGARPYFRRAAEAGSGEAALALGATYEDRFIKAIGAQGIKSDHSKARAWYERAKRLGATTADDRLIELTRVESLALSSPSSKVDSARASNRLAAPMLGEIRPIIQTPPPQADDESRDAATWVEPSGAVNVRKFPSPKGEMLGVIQKGTKVRVLFDDGNWLRVIDPKTGETGWIYANAVETIAALPPEHP